MRTIIFGAGNIGRGFLAKLLYDAGHQVTFVDTNAELVTTINQQHQYPVYIVGTHGTTESIVCNVSAINLEDHAALIPAIIDAELILTAVGKNALASVATVLAMALACRSQIRPDSEIGLVVVACENMTGNTSYLADLIKSNLINAKLAKQVLASVNLPNCVVDRIVPNTRPELLTESSLAVSVEDYFQLAIDSRGLRADFPAIQGIELAEDLEALLEQKLFTLNMAHVITAYYGYLLGYRYIHEAILDPIIISLMRGALQEVQTLLVSRHSSITLQSQSNYSNKIVERFKNPYLRDEVMRVARDPVRKLGPQDRLVRPAILSINNGQTPAHLAGGVAAALHYDYAADQTARDLAGQVRQHGIETVFELVSGIAPSSNLSNLVSASYHLLSI